MPVSEPTDFEDSTCKAFLMVLWSSSANLSSIGEWAKKRRKTEKKTVDFVDALHRECAYCGCSVMAGPSGRNLANVVFSRRRK